MPTNESQVLVEIVRGEVVESVHRGRIAVATADGRVIAQWGDIARPTFPRSAVKPLQALPLVESGAADHFALDTTELALACASHSGRAEHVAAVSGWLRRLDLESEALECGAHWPSDPEAARALAAQGATPCPLHNNCSGKHCGFLTTARYLGVPTAGYIHPDHPVQRRVSAALGEMMGLDMAGVPWAVDGCGIPTFAPPLVAVATGMARLADPSGLGSARAEACARLRAAMSRHPDMVAGPGRACTAILQAVPGIVVKGGAEGVYAAALPRQGLGIALKIDDGANRAAELAIVALLHRFADLTAQQRDSLAAWLHPNLRNVAGRMVGALRPAAGWLAV